MYKKFKIFLYISLDFFINYYTIIKTDLLVNFSIIAKCLKLIFI